jgi:hypothetical protein
MKNYFLPLFFLVFALEARADFSVHMVYGEKAAAARVTKVGNVIELTTMNDGIRGKRVLKKEDYDYLLKKMSLFPKESDSKDCGREKIELRFDDKPFLRGCARSSTPASESLRQLLDLLFSI